ncbi:preQ(0) biosynthesis protein QueD [Sulfurivirga caldicuralii]|uniref:6-carboxy-5,6,7,8-tetrahydropterin synthase n=1 Tax=Sulfurivirga caldicuralii TaxID=364032 RepID=A0A1N6F6H9_9GAMM|nr:6-carboxytetrahydropterin synthase QueD [Sulfurivirga caldicuralii]SIN90892.1 preQ(0) biosynthesis protein QueD [Sulfurivirga caldicuralii]
MKKRFTLKTLLDFAAAHRLHGYDGDCAKLHGHNWKVEVMVTGEQLDDVGMVIDFKEIKRHAKAVVAELDHTYLNDHPAFQNQNPTAENIAAYLFERLAERIDTPQRQVSAITVWENDRNCVTFSVE